MGLTVAPQKAGIAWPDGLDLGFSVPSLPKGTTYGGGGTGRSGRAKGFKRPFHPVIANEMPVGSAAIAFNEPDKCGDGQSCMIKDGDIANLKESMPGLVDK
jgi:hypothetical protein